MIEVGQWSHLQEGSKVSREAQARQLDFDVMEQIILSAFALKAFRAAKRSGPAIKSS